MYINNLFIIIKQENNSKKINKQNIYTEEPSLK